MVFLAVYAFAGIAAAGTPLLGSTLPPGSTPPLGSLVWPQPQSQTTTNATLRVDAAAFKFETGSTSAVLAAALKRYRPICFPPGRRAATPNSALPQLRALRVTVASANESLALNVSERYELRIAAAGGTSTLTADTVWGAVRGLESFAQLLNQRSDGAVLAQSVVDWPRFPFRSVMVDSARHFLPVELLRAHIDALAYAKMNRMHWHLTDTCAFPYASTLFPNLSAAGAFDAAHVYSPADVGGLVEYGRLRGVVIVPEFDSPGHSTPGWRGGPPQLLAACGIRPDLEENYSFLDALFSEAIGVFASSDTFHMGGDEFGAGCWDAVPAVKAFRQAKNWTSARLLQYYMSKVFAIVAKHKKDPMLWKPGVADTFPASALPKNTIFDLYSGPSQLPPDGQGGYNASAAATTARGFRVVRSAGFYLDQLCDLDPDQHHSGTYWGYFGGWKYYDKFHDPQEFSGGRRELVIGGQASMWGEHVDAANFLPRVWPRAAVVAERLWSARNQTKVDEAAYSRLHAFRCGSLVGRGIAAEPIGSGHDGAYRQGFCERELRYEYRPPF